MGQEEIHLHQKDSPPTKNLHHADTETSSVIGSHLAHGRVSSTKEAFGVCSASP